jgi:hypothetical protein
MSGWRTPTAQITISKPISLEVLTSIGGFEAASMLLMGCGNPMDGG